MGLFISSEIAEYQDQLVFVVGNVKPKNYNLVLACKFK